MTFLVSDEQADIREKKKTVHHSCPWHLHSIKIPLYISEVFRLSLKVKTPKLEYYKNSLTLQFWNALLSVIVVALA